MSLFEYEKKSAYFTPVRIKEILLYYYHTNHVGTMSKDDIHHKCAHPADNARPTVLSNAINFVTLVYLLCTQQAAFQLLGSEQIRNVGNCYQFSDVSVSGLEANGLYIGKKSFWRFVLKGNKSRILQISCLKHSLIQNTGSHHPKKKKKKRSSKISLATFFV